MTRAVRTSLLATLALAAGAAAAQEAPPERRFEVRPAGEGPQRLEVPAAFLSASARGDLADLRLVDAAGEEVPYLLVPPPAAAPASWVEARRIRAIPATRTASGFEADLGAVRAVTALELPLDRWRWVKQLRLEGSADGRRWVVLAPDAVLYQLPFDAAPCEGAACRGVLARRAITFDPAEVRFLRVVFDDRRGPRPPLPRGARARLASTPAPAVGPLVPLAVERRPGEPGTSRFALRLPGPHLPVQAVVLEVDAARLARRARVLEARLEGGRLAPLELGSGLLLQLAGEGAVASELRVPIAAPEELELELAVEDGDNPPLALTAARAELPPQPWIFFESRDGGPLEARLGPARAAPRYDLEALRPQLARLRPARAAAAAAAGPAEGTAPPAAAAAIPEAARAGAPVDRAAFRGARGIAPASPGLAAVRLDLDVLRGSSLADLRIVGPDDRQVPYLLERRAEPLPVPLEERAASGGDAPPRALTGPGLTVHALRLPAPDAPAARMILETRARVFSRTVRVFADAASPGLPPSPVAEGTWAHADPDRPAPPLALDLPRLGGGRLWVTVNDGDNAPLQLSAARLLLPAWRLRFFHPGPALALLHGAELPAPQYDLALLAPRLRAAAAREVALLPPGALPAGGGASGAGAAARATPWVFWIVLGAAVIGLLGLVARLLLRAGPPSPDA